MNKKNPNWSELPRELLELVVTRLDLIDVVRFKGVCSSWFLSAKVGCLLSPILMLQSKTDIGDDDEYLKIFGKTLRSLSLKDMNKVIYAPQNKKNLEKLLDKGYCNSSSHGWMVVLDKDVNLLLLNPFSGAEIALEPAKETGYPHLPNVSKVEKVILTDNPTFVKDFKVVMNNGDSISFCCPAGAGDGLWRSLKSQGWIEDVAFHRNTLYAVQMDSVFNARSDACRILTWDMSQHDPLKSESESTMKIPCSSKQVPYNNGLRSRCYLASSMEEIFLIIVFQKVTIDHKPVYSMVQLTLPLKEEKPACNIVGFEIYKVVYEKDRKELIPVESLPGQAMFLGTNQGVVISVENDAGLKENSIYYIHDTRMVSVDESFCYIADDDDPKMISVENDEALKKNKIYYTSERFNSMNRWCWRYHDIVLYSLEDMSIKLLCASQTQAQPGPLWLFPSLK